jgi:hypothetical protein
VLWLGRRSDQLAEGVEDLFQLLVVLTHPSFDLLQSLLEGGVGAGDRRNSTNARMISMFPAMARSLRRTPDSIATPCSVKT